MRKSFSNSSKTSSRPAHLRPSGYGGQAAIAAALVIAAALNACGGSNGSGGGSSPPPAGGGTTCATASLEAESGDVAPPAEQALLQQQKRERLDGNPRDRYLDALWLNRSRADRIRTRSSLTAGRDSIDVGEIAVLQDEGDLIEPPNPYDLRNLGLRFSRNTVGGYDVTRIDGEFRTGLGSRLTLTDDDSVSLNVPFGFSFYGRNQSTAFVNSDGNITFEAEDRASTDRNVSRVLTGPPRIALFFADLDPSAGGRVFGNAASDRYTVTWCGVRGFDSTRTVNAQVTLLPSGAIEMKFNEVTLGSAVVAVSPGRTGEFTPVNLSDSGTQRGAANAAVGERFADEAQLDTVELARKFYRTHADNFDQLVIWTDVSVIDNAFAYESTVANEVRGIGVAQFDASRDFGSAGRLRSFTMMDWIGKYPEDPLQTFLGENNTVSVLGQEVGHRWLAFMEFRNHAGVRSEALLGRDQSHWSFFMDTDASVMEGNDIEDLGGGSFRTVGAVRRYSLLDQYAMGLIPESQVPPFFYVDNPINVPGSRDESSAPRIGISFNGTRRDVLISDIVAILGPRQPAAADSSRIHRQAFILLVSAGRSPDNGQIAKLDRIRRAWETFFSQATDNRMQAVTVLR